MLVVLTPRVSRRVGEVLPNRQGSKFDEYGPGQLVVITVLFGSQL